MCDSCEVLNINGVNCHEFGCPEKAAELAAEREAERSEF